MSGLCGSICSHDIMWWFQCCFWQSQRSSGLWSCCHLPWELCLDHWNYFSGSSVFWMVGAISIPIFALTPGWNPMVPCPPASTLLASRLPAFTLCLPVLLFHVLSLITMPFFPVSPSLNCFLVALADGDWMFPFSGILYFFKLSATSGQDRSRPSPLFSSLQHWWDPGKEHLKSLAVRHCSGAHNERSQSRSVLSALACHL